MTSRVSLLLLSALMLSACTGLTRVSRVSKAPDISIVTPELDEQFRQGEGDVLLHATVTDSYDEPHDLTVTWVIDDGEPWAAVVDDEGNATASIAPDALTLGPHQALVRAVDTDGSQATAGVRFIILGPLGAPSVLITSPDEGTTVAPGVNLAFRGEATDVSTAPQGLTFVWNSDLDDDLDGAVSADGESLMLTDSLSVGTHLITLSVTDEDGEVGEDTVTVTVFDDFLAQPGDLVFSEFMVNPQVVDDEVGEWVELYNTSGQPLDVTGYRFHDDDNDSWVLEGPLVAPANGYLVLCANTDPSVNGGVNCDGWFLRDPSGLGLALANNPDEIVLSRPDGVEIDWVHYEDDWFQAGAASGVAPGSLEGGANDFADAWCVQTTVIMSGGEAGTPGQINDLCE